MVAAVLPAEGALEYIAPAFEHDTLQSFALIEGRLNCWEEHESPYDLLARVLASMEIQTGRIGIDEATPFFAFDGIGDR